MNSPESVQEGWKNLGSRLHQVKTGSIHLEERLRALDAHVQSRSRCTGKATYASVDHNCGFP